MNKKIKIKESEFKIEAVRASGPGGQHVNKVSSGVQLRFDINASSLSPEIKYKLLRKKDKRINKSGVLILKNSKHRSQNKNKKEVIARLSKIIEKASRKANKRIKTKPTGTSIKKRLRKKKKRSEVKKWRNKPKVE